MKKLVLIFSVVFATLNIFGQSHQEDILKFVDDNKGKKIGTGLCYELVQGAIRTYDASYDGRSADKGKYGKSVKLKDIQPGDILVLSGGTKRKANHVCIVYSIDGEYIWVAEQNTKGSLKKSIVVVNLLNYEWDRELYGKVRYNFYRQ